MSALMIANGILLAVAFALVFGGAATALTGANMVKRVAGVIAALTGAMLGLANLGASSAMLIAAVAIALAYCALGASLIVRFQESYGAIETQAIDDGDRNDEPREPRT